MTPCLRPLELAALVAGRLPETERQRAEEHLDQCQACAHGWQQLIDADGLCGEIQSAIETQRHSEPGVRDLSGSGIEGYEILNEIHRGGQGVVYRALQAATKRTVALKVPLRGAHTSDRQRTRFAREIDPSFR